MGIRRNDHHLYFVSMLLWLVLCCGCFVVQVRCEEDSYSSALFEPSPLIEVAGPSVFRKPTSLFHDPNITVVVEPTFGKHRQEQDAVLAYAEGYGLEYYRFFVETLVATGFTGDVVFAISDATMVQPNVAEYLKTYSEELQTNPDGLNIVVYMHELNCYDSDMKTRVKRQKNKHGDMDIFQMCALDHVYGYKDPDTGKVISTVPDIRDGRVVATLRYEWYWIWSLRYNPHSWLMLLDARDSYFQSNPFEQLPRTKQQQQQQTTKEDNGYLYFYGENHEATRLGISTKNRNWIKNGYGDHTIAALMDKPTICSGSTMGEQIAVETYLRAMVNEWDETDIRMTGSDQGFHNYLYYSSKLKNARTIKAIIVWEQGKGHINNLSALRTKTLQEWGIYHPPHDRNVYQWDNKTVSPVVHQYDRDQNLHSYTNRERMRPLKKWSKKK